MKRLVTFLVLGFVAVLLAGCGGTEHNFTGQGILRASEPFKLEGGSYNVLWVEHPVNSDWPFTTWHFGVSIHDPVDSSKNYHLLFSEDSLSAIGEQSGRAVVSGIEPGEYVLDVAAGEPFNWAVKLSP